MTTVPPSIDLTEMATAFDIDHAIEHISHWLPIQGPIKDFVHHNTLHAVQNHPFHEGVAIAAKVFGARSYLSAAEYQERYRQGRIKDFALDWALAQSGCDPETYSELRRKLFFDSTEHYPPVSLANHGIRTNWLNQLEVDLNSLVHPIMFRLLGNFLDQGICRWTLTKPAERFWDCVCRLVQNSLLPLYPFDSQQTNAYLDGTPDQVIGRCLGRLVGDGRFYEQYLLELLLSHPGWAGMVRLIELNPSALLEPRLISLKEMIAVELAAELAILTKKKGKGFIAVAAAPHSGDIPLLGEYEAQPQVPLLLKIWHEAMEYSLHSELLVALNKRPAPVEARQPLMAQAVFCIDDRECSIRRYLEEANPDIETFGAAGFFGIDFFYQGFDDAYPVAQCPNIITPQHLVKETGAKTETEKNGLTEGLSDLHIKPHSLFRGWLYTQLLGVGYAARMIWDVFRPGSQLLKISQLSEVQAHTHLHLLRESDELAEDGRLLGFSVPEMADKIEGLLRNIGLTKQFAPVVVIVAHGSSSTNNPHFAAYDCGACSGKPGAPNARAFAWMANYEPVRQILRERGIDIPASTHFVPALRNTSRDEITYFDRHLYAQYPAGQVAKFQTAMEGALRKNALERCRWFELAPQSGVHDDAHSHVIARASSIFEPRPEYNHSNNLYCVVGRRSLTCGLFMDRRAFLHSYDPHTDLEGTLLMKILSAIIPVCGGINLEYLFSRIDNSIYGAGTKLPHNVIGLLGVANGVEGDLRTGLPQQMIEVHEPSRLLIVIEQTTANIEKTFAKLGDGLMEWLDNDWVRLAACHPESRDLWFYHRTGWQAIRYPEDFVPPSGDDSETVYRGRESTLPVHVLKKVA